MLYAPDREAMVQEFHESMGHSVDVPLTTKEMNLRLTLIGEEVKELMDEGIQMHMEISRNGRPNIETKANFLKEMADVQYVLSGLAVAFGFDLDGAFDAVHTSNLTKLDDNGKPILRDDGKVIKGPNYEAPDMRMFV